MSDLDVFASEQPDGAPVDVDPAPPPRRQRRESSAARRAKLLDVAVRVFYRKGYADTTLQDIADEMGFTKPAIYYYAKNKEELLVEIYTQIVEPAIERAQEIADGPGNGAERFFVLVRQHLATFLANIEANAVFEVHRTLSAEAKASVQRLGREYGGILTEVYREGIADGSLRDVDPTIAVNAVLGMCNTVHLWYHPAGRLSTEDLIEQLAGLFGDGARTARRPAKKAARG